jgi:hypothetical protein
MSVQSVSDVSPQERRGLSTAFVKFDMSYKCFVNGRCLNHVTGGSMKSGWTGLGKHSSRGWSTCVGIVGGCAWLGASCNL